MLLSIDPGTITGAAVLWDDQKPLSFVTWELKGRPWRSPIERMKHILWLLECGTQPGDLDVVVCEHPIPVAGRNNSSLFTLVHEMKLWAGLTRKARWYEFYPSTWWNGLGGHRRPILRRVWQEWWGLENLTDHQVDAVGLGWWYQATTGYWGSSS